MRGIVARAVVVAALLGLGVESPPARAAGLACLGGEPPHAPVAAGCSAAGVPVEIHRGRGRGAQPVIIWMHGGAWSFGTASDIDPVIRDQLERGWTVVSVDYRLSGTARMHDIVTDVRTAVRWTRLRATDLNVDPDRMVLAGFSAGAHLAALAGLAPGSGEWRLPSRLRDIPGRPAGVLALSGVYDLRSYDGDLSLLGPTDLVLGHVIGCTGTDDVTVACSRRRLARFSPITAIDGRDPPVMLVHGADDAVVPVGQARGMYRALVAEGIDARLAVWSEDHSVEIDHTHRRVERFLDRIGGTSP